MKSFLIVRTPLQAWIAPGVLQRERTVCFDVLYISVNDSAEDRKAFSQIKDAAENAWYVVCRPRSPDLLHQIEMAVRLAPVRWKCRGCCWKAVFLASYDSHSINALSVNASAHEIVTFDDGTANINTQSMYAPEMKRWRDRVYRRAFGGLSNRAFIDRVARHYTIFGEADHLMDRSRLRYLEPLFAGNGNALSEDSVTYFIGAPFSEVLSAAQIDRLNSAVERLHINYVVRHPRQTEKFGFETASNILDKQGEIAERAIETHANGRRITLVGWFSTVMFTMRPLAARRIVLLASDDSKTPGMKRIAENASCEIIQF